MFKVKLLVLYVAAAIVVATIAKQRGRSGIAWFFLALIVTPIFAGVAVTLLKHASRLKLP